MTFKSSVNIRFDLGKAEFFERYMPTPSHAGVLRGLLRGFNYKESRAHIIVGPYGTGKSLLGTLVTGIVSKTVEPHAFETLMRKFDQVDDEIYKELEKVRDHKYTYLPVILNGYEGNFRQAILSAIMRVLKQYQISIVVPGVVSKILSIIDTWQQNYKKTYKKFIQLLDENGKDLELWRIELLNFNEKEIEWFKNIYPLLTSGAEFVSDFEEEFIFQIQYVLKELEKQDKGLFIVYDEFGRFLQNIPVHQIYQTMQDIQDLAELADHSSDNFHIMYITHKNLRHYFLKYNEEYRNEFQRIEKRYTTYHIESDRATYVRLIQSIINELYGDIQIPESKEKNYISYLRKFPLFPDFNQVEIEKLVVRGAYPLHPVALALLPSVSSLFGQNERTLFTFLESHQVGGLMNFVSQYKGVYSPANLFDYFFPNIDDVELEEDFQELNVYQKLVKKIPNLMDHHLDVLKFITLWNITGFQAKYPLTSDLIAFALDYDENEIETVLNYLVKNKAIRFNPILGYWELFEGSGLDIEEIIAEKSEGFHVKRDRKIQILEEHLVKRFYLANEYNDIKSMTRFASVHLLFSSDVLNENFGYLTQDRYADAFVYLVLLESISDRDKVIEKLMDNKDLYNFYCIPNFEYSGLDKYIDNFEIINMLLKDKELLKTDPNLKQELLLKKEEVSFTIRNFLRRYTNFDKELIWIVSGQTHQIANEFMLQKLLSDMMMQRYPFTPEVRNDSYNRRVVNRVQLKAGYNVVDHILKYPDQPQFNIKGNGPDYLIYATIFKNNKLDISNLDQISDKNFRLMREKLIELLKNKPSGSLRYFKDIFVNSPFGVREPLIPIYFVSLLRDKWDNLSFYRNDMYVPEINGEKLFSMLAEADQYDYVYYEFGKEYEGLFEALETTFLESMTGDLMSMPRHLRAANAALKWLRSLPRFTQISNQMDGQLIKLKEIIRQIEVNPNQALEKLVKLYGDNLNLLNEHVIALEQFCEDKKEHFKREVLQTINVNSYDALKDWANQQDPAHKKQNRLVASILDSSKEDWFNVLVDRLVGVTFENWSDNTSEMFLVQIRHEYSQINDKHNKEGENNIYLSVNGQTKVVTKVNLSPKSQTLYRNIYRIIKNGGRTVPKEEIEYLIYELIEEFIK
jgi:hypothetical protein